MEMRPPAKMPIARKARTRAGDPPAEKKPPDEPGLPVGDGLAVPLVVGVVEVIVEDID